MRFLPVSKRHPLPCIFLRVLVGLAAVVSALVVMLAMYTTITERTREIGILKRWAPLELHRFHH